MHQLAFELKAPVVRTTSVIFASPHSGRSYPDAFTRDSLLDQLTLRSSEDAFVDQLFDVAPTFGAPLLVANAPRAYVDLNRGREELDPALIEGVRKNGHNPRVSSGLGVVPRVVANGRAIYRGKLTRSEADNRLRDVWVPYHNQLQQLLTECHAQFGEAILIDCHSMPHEAIESVSLAGRKHPDIVLGDRFGAAAGSEVVERIESAFAGAGLEVVRNAPFAGAYTTQHYGRPSREQHVIQVEIDRSLYMDEGTIQPHSGFDDFRALMADVVGEIAGIGLAEMPLAAE